MFEIALVDIEKQLRERLSVIVFDRKNQVAKLLVPDQTLLSKQFVQVMNIVHLPSVMRVIGQLIDVALKVLCNIALACEQPHSDSIAHTLKQAVTLAAGAPSTLGLRLPRVASSYP
jgi:hypothetical protein